MQLWPPGSFFWVRFNTFFREFLSDCSNNRRVQTTRKQYTIRYIRHQLSFYSRFQTITNFFNNRRIDDFPFVISCFWSWFYCIVRFPIPFVPFSWFFVFRIEIRAVREFFNCLAFTFQSFQFWTNIVSALFIPTLIKWNYTNFITSNKISFVFAVIQSKSKNTAKLFNHFGKVSAFAILFIKRNNSFTVRTCLESIFSFKFFTNIFVIINFTVSRKNDFLIITY